MKVIPSVIKLVRKVVDELRRLPPPTRYSFPNNMAQFLSMEIWFAIWRAGLRIHVRSCLKIWTPKISWVDHPENPMASHHFPHWNGHLKNPRGAGWKPQAWTSGPCQHPYEGMNWSQSQMWPQMDRVGWDEAIHFTLWLWHSQFAIENHHL